RARNRERSGRTRLSRTAAARSPLHEIGVLPSAAASGGDRRARGKPLRVIGRRRSARGHVYALGWGVQQSADRRHRLPSPRRALPDPTPTRHRPRPHVRGRRRARLVETILGARASLWIGGCLCKLPRSGPHPLGSRVPRAELRPLTARQGEVRPFELFPVQAIPYGLSYEEVARSSRRTRPARVSMIVRPICGSCFSALRNARRGSVMTLTALVAEIVADLGPPSTRAISPKKSPDRRTRDLPSTRARPSSMRKNELSWAP